MTPWKGIWYLLVSETKTMLFCSREKERMSDNSYNGKTPQHK